MNSSLYISRLDLKIFRMKKPTQFFTNLNADRDANQKKSRHVIFMCDNSFDHKIFIMNLLESMLSFFLEKSKNWNRSKLYYTINIAPVLDFTLDSFLCRSKFDLLHKKCKVKSRTAEFFINNYPLKVYIIVFYFFIFDLVWFGKTITLICIC